MFLTQARRACPVLRQARSFTSTTPAAFLRPDYQKVIVHGRVGDDARRVEFKDGTGRWNFPVVTREGKKNPETGEWKNVLLWHQVQLEGELPQDFEKGAYVIVEGKLSYYKAKGEGPNIAKIKVAQRGINVTRRADEDLRASHHEQGAEGEQHRSEHQEDGERSQAYG
ncbi:uncharacterized protein EV422DRAFT_539291, partial [Fimicolochytrium jonesii]|uniref:uncharacterized protein n=1 Tax=Fimicolochytrium jonesii TaxID=1396493 RepID=UPI0022FED439